MIVGAPDRSSMARRALCAVMALVATPQSGGVGTRTLGVDFGLRRVGLALSGGFAPLPLSVLPCDDDDAANDFRDIARRSARVAVGEGASQIVVGMPLNAAGGEGEQANVTRMFASTLAMAAAPLPVFLWDERFSSAEARLRMTAYASSTTGALDSVAATVILESFFAAPAEVRLAAEYVPLTEAQQSAFDTARAAAQSAAAARPPPLSASEVRRRMLEEVAQQNQGGAGQGRPKRKPKRGKGR